MQPPGTPGHMGHPFPPPIDGLTTPPLGDDDAYLGPGQGNSTVLNTSHYNTIHSPFPSSPSLHSVFSFPSSSSSSSSSGYPGHHPHHGVHRSSIHDNSNSSHGGHPHPQQEEMSEFVASLSMSSETAARYVHPPYDPNGASSLTKLLVKFAPPADGMYPLNNINHHQSSSVIMTFLFLCNIIINPLTTKTTFVFSTPSILIRTYFSYSLPYLSLSIYIYI